MKRKKLVVLTGAGISAESGLRTFREAGGLWEGHDVTQVASPSGWANNRKMVLDFYNERRKQALSALPNKGHQGLAKLESDLDVVIVTQNVDNLHEQAGSSHVIHLHGELFIARSSIDESLVYPIDGWELKEGDLCERGSQLRPHIVWFGEPVPLMEQAVFEAESADLFAVIGTSLLVYPAAGLIEFVLDEVPKFIIDPNLPGVTQKENLYLIEKVASEGVREMSDLIRQNFI